MIDRTMTITTFPKSTNGDDGNDSVNGGYDWQAVNLKSTTTMTENQCGLCVCMFTLSALRVTHTNVTFDC